MWQVLTCANDLESKYKVIEALIDGNIHSHTKEVVKEWINKNGFITRIDTKDLLAFLASLEDNKK